MNKKTIKHCPFCGSVHTIIREYPRFYNLGFNFKVACDVCGATGPGSKTCQGALEAWNRGAK